MKILAIYTYCVKVIISDDQFFRVIAKDQNNDLCVYTTMVDSTNDVLSPIYSVDGIDLIDLYITQVKSNSYIVFDIYKSKEFEDMIMKELL